MVSSNGTAQGHNVFVTGGVGFIGGLPCLPGGP